MKVCKHLKGAFRVGNETMCQACQIKDLQEQLEQLKDDYRNLSKESVGLHDELALCEARNERLAHALAKIARVNAMDYEYRRWAKEALNQRKGE